MINTDAVSPTTQDTALIVRPMVNDDVPRVADLAVQLGYNPSAEEVSSRLEALSATPGHAFFVADPRSQPLTGWIHVYGVQTLVSTPYAEIGGIVVEQTVRRRGVGQAILRAAEEWATANGFPEVRLRSGVHREEAHLFYERVGYERSRASYMFRRKLL
jgi:GNAT superfamily N-acetyltransferase